MLGALHVPLQVCITICEIPETRKWPLYFHHRILWWHGAASARHVTTLKSAYSSTPTMGIQMTKPLRRGLIAWSVALIVLLVVALSYNQVDLIVNWVIKLC
jgi:hypothetical protein